MDRWRKQIQKIKTIIQRHSSTVQLAIAYKTQKVQFKYFKNTTFLGSYEQRFKIVVNYMNLKYSNLNPVIEC